MLAGVLIAICVTACSSADDDRTVGIEPREARLVDTAGLVAAHEFNFRTELPAGGPPSVEPAPEGPWDLRVMWTAFGCQTLPTVTVMANEPQAAHLLIDPGPRVGVDGSVGSQVDCDAMAVAHTVLLQLDPALDPTSVSVSLNPASG